jgi:hypothetical protein
LWTTADELLNQRRHKHEVVISAVTFSKRKIVRLAVEGVETDCLVDTGADRTLINADLVRGLKVGGANIELQPTIIRVRAEGGALLKVLGEVRVALGPKHDDMTWNCVVVEGMLHDLIFGNDLFDAYGVVINYRQGFMYCDAFSKPLKLQNINAKRDAAESAAAETSRPLNTSEKATVPPRAQTHLVITVDSSTPAGTYMVERVQARNLPHLHVASVLVTVTDEQREIPVRVMNTGDKPIHINKGLCVGKLTSLPETHCAIVVCEDSSVRETAKTATTDVKMENATHIGAAETGTDGLPDLKIVIDGVDLSHLPVQQQQELRALLHEFGDVMSRGKSDLGRTSVTKATIDTQGHPPIRTAPYRQAYAHREIIEKEIGRDAQAGHHLQIAESMGSASGLGAEEERGDEILHRLPQDQPGNQETGQRDCAH